MIWMSVKNNPVLSGRGLNQLCQDWTFASRCWDLVGFIAEWSQSEALYDQDSWANEAWLE